MGKKRMVIVGAIFTILMFCNFVFWDYYDHDTYNWGENIIQALIAGILFMLFQWLIKNNKRKKDSTNN